MTDRTEKKIDSSHWASEVDESDLATARQKHKQKGAPVGKYLEKVVRLALNPCSAFGIVDASFRQITQIWHFCAKLTSMGFRASKNKVSSGGNPTRKPPLDQNFNSLTHSVNL